MFSWSLFKTIANVGPHQCPGYVHLVMESMFLRSLFKTIGISGLWGFGLSWRVIAAAGHCTTVFTKQFLPWVLPRLGGGVGNRRVVTSGVNPDPVHSTPRRWKRLRSPSSVGEGGRSGRASQSFSSTWGWVMIFCTWGRLEPALGGNRRSGVPAGQSSRRDRRTGAGPF